MMERTNDAAGCEKIIDVVRSEKLKIEKLRKSMEDILYSYPRWRAEVVFEDEGYSDLFPHITVNYDFPESSNEIGDIVFSTVARRIGSLSEVKKKVEMVNVFLSSLDYENRKFVDLKYFKKERKEKVMIDLYLSDWQYKVIRRTVLDLLLSLLVKGQKERTA